MHLEVSVLCHYVVLPSAILDCIEYRNVLCLLRIAADGYTMSLDTPRCNHRCHVYTCMSKSIACVHPEASSAIKKHNHKMNNKRA